MFRLFIACFACFGQAVPWHVLACLPARFNCMIQVVDQRVYSMFRLFWPGGALTCFGMFVCKLQLLTCLCAGNHHSADMWCQVSTWVAKLGRRGFTRSSLTDQKAHCVEAARSCQMLSRVITKQHHETVLIQCLNAMVGITRSKVFFWKPTYIIYHIICSSVPTVPRVGEPDKRTLSTTW